jgi:hypothetical protein
VRDVGRDSGLVKDANSNLGIRRFRADLKVSITQALANSVNTNQGTSTKEVLTLKRARTHWVLFSPDAVHILREEL